MASKVIQSRLLAVDPWAAAGPGWSNHGVTAYYEDTLEDGSCRVRSEALQGREMSAEQTLAWKVGLAAASVLRRAFGGDDGD